MNPGKISDEFTQKGRRCDCARSPAPAVFIIGNIAFDQFTVAFPQRQLPDKFACGPCRPVNFAFEFIISSSIPITSSPRAIMQAPVRVATSIIAVGLYFEA